MDYVEPHRKPEGIRDRIAFAFVKFLRFFADLFFRKRYGHRAVVLETVAAVPGMLSWPAGASPDDGVWAPHWYDAVWRSTGFGPPPGDRPEVAPDLQPIYKDALEIYETIAQHKLTLT